MNKVKSFLKFNLFWKIFIWFWLTFILLLTIFLFAGYINSGKIHFRKLPPPAFHDLNITSKKINRWLDKRSDVNKKTRHRREIFLLDEEGNNYFGYDAPELLSELHRRVKRHNHPLLAMRKSKAFFGGNILKVDGKEYYLYLQQRSQLFSKRFLFRFFEDIAISLLIGTFLISFPLSFFLSWLMTKPIKRLQKATFDLQENIGNRKELKKLQERSDEFSDLALDIDQMATHLQNLLGSQKQLLSDASHELRSPLTRLQIAVGLAEQKASQEDKNLVRIKQESKRMNEMLENLLTLSRLESQEVELEMESCNLSKIFEQVIEDGQFEATAANIKIHQDIASTSNIKANKDTLLSGIENILRNAIRYSGENGEVFCKLIQEDNQLELSISDNGPGVKEEQLERLFDAFYRPNEDRARKSGGVGLGLSIAKRAFELNGATIQAENITPHGLKVSIKFNLS